MFNVDSVRYVKMGLLIGTHDPSLADRLTKLDSLAEIGKMINEELGTNIQRGDSLQSVVDTIKQTLDIRDDH